MREIAEFLKRLNPDPDDLTILCGDFNQNGRPSNHKLYGIDKDFPDKVSLVKEQYTSMLDALSSSPYTLRDLLRLSTKGGRG